jgi:hypothetical protein
MVASVARVKNVRPPMYRFYKIISFSWLWSWFFLYLRTYILGRGSCFITFNKCRQFKIKNTIV